MADADECIRLAPAFEKGYFRKAAALETGEKYDEVRRWRWRAALARAGTGLAQGWHRAGTGLAQGWH